MQSATRDAAVAVVVAARIQAAAPAAVVVGVGPKLPLTYRTLRPLPHGLVYLWGAVSLLFLLVLLLAVVLGVVVPLQVSLVGRIPLLWVPVGDPFERQRVAPELLSVQRWLGSCLATKAHYLEARAGQRVGAAKGAQLRRGAAVDHQHPEALLGMRRRRQEEGRSHRHARQTAK